MIEPSSWVTVTLPAIALDKNLDLIRAFQQYLLSWFKWDKVSHFLLCHEQGYLKGKVCNILRLMEILEDEYREIWINLLSLNNNLALFMML